MSVIPFDFGAWHIFVTVMALWRFRIFCLL